MPALNSVGVERGLSGAPSQGTTGVGHCARRRRVLALRFRREVRWSSSDRKYCIAFRSAIKSCVHPVHVHLHKRKMTCAIVCSENPWRPVLRNTRF